MELSGNVSAAGIVLQKSGVFHLEARTNTDQRTIGFTRKIRRSHPKFPEVLAYFERATDRNECFILIDKTNYSLFARKSRAVTSPEFYSCFFGCKIIKGNEYLLRKTGNA